MTPDMPHVLKCIVEPEPGKKIKHYLRSFENGVCETTVWPSQAKPFWSEGEARLHQVYGVQSLDNKTGLKSTPFEVAPMPTTPKAKD